MFQIQPEQSVCGAGEEPYPIDPKFMGVHQERAALIALVAIQTTLGYPLAIRIRYLLDTGNPSNLFIDVRINVTVRAVPITKNS